MIKKLFDGEEFELYELLEEIKVWSHSAYVWLYPGYYILTTPSYVLNKPENYWYYFDVRHAQLRRIYRAGAVRALEEFRENLINEK